MRSERGEREREKEEKREEKIRIKIVFFFFFFFFFFIYIYIYKSVRMFFHMRSGHFSNMLEKLFLDLVDHIR